MDEDVQASQSLSSQCGAATVLKTPAAAALAASAPLAMSAPVPKTLRVAFPTAETGFDPAQVQDLYSRTVIGHILDAPLEFDLHGAADGCCVRTRS